MELKDFAAMLNNREYKYPLFTENELQIAKDNGFVIVSGASDDLAEIEGAITAEADCWEGGKIFVEAVPNGKLMKNAKKPNVVSFTAKWCEEKDENGNIISWTYKTSIPHETFMIYEDGMPYCRGFVFKLADVNNKTTKSNMPRTTILTVAKLVREYMENKYGPGTNLCGHCIEASEKIVNSLNELDIQAKTVEGWCIYEDDSTCTDRCYDEHTWVEAYGLYIDVTADQFNSCMINKLKPVYVGRRPDCMVYEKPNYTWLEEKNK